MNCKFCGCTDLRACAIPMVFGDHPLEDDMPALALPGQVADFTTACHWSAPSICSAPACIDLAYVEACVLIDQIYLEEAA
jgi:hypothetical protein